MEFSTGTALRFGWETFKKRPWFFVAAGLLILLVSFVVGVVTSSIDWALTGSPDEPSLVGSLINTALGILIYHGRHGVLSRCAR